MTQLDQVLDDLGRATNAALVLARELAASRGDEDDWRRLPPAGSRCEISGWSRSKVVNLINEGSIRGKKVGASRFYSGTDMRRHLSGL